MEVIPFSLVLALLFPLLFIAYKSSSRRRRGLPPSPAMLPLIGNLHQLGALPHQSIHALSKKHGPIMLLRFGSIDNIVITSASAAEEILKTQDPVFSSRPQLELARRLFHNCRDVIFSPQGDYWRNIRKICAVHLLSNKKVQSFRAVREEEVSLLVGRIAAVAGAPVNLTELLNSFSCHLIGRISLGMRREADVVTLCQLITEGSLLFGGFYVRDFFPYLGWWAWLSGMDARIERLSRAWDSFLDKVIREHQQGDRDDDDDQSGDLVDVLLGLQKEGFDLSSDGMKGILHDIFAAGTDTSYIAMVWTISELIRHPEQMRKVQAEVRAVASGKAAVDADDVGQLVYLKAVIKESLRLHPPAPMLVPREPMEDAVVHGYRVPRRSKVLVSCWSIGRDPARWEDAEEFRPERFTESSVDFRGYDFDLIPFGAGRRICPGMQFAVSSMELTLANLLFRFDWKMPDGMSSDDLDMDEAPGFTTQRKSNLILLPVGVNLVHVV